VAVFDGGQLTYRQLDQASDRVAANLVAAGIEPGDRVALQLPNIPQFLTSYFGILKAGAVVVPLNVLLRAPEIANHLEDSGALVLITWEGVLAEAVMDAEAAGNGAIFAVGHAPSLPRRLYPGVFGDVLLEIGDEFRGKGAPGLADGVADVVGGDEFLAVLEQDALEGQLRGAAGGELDVGRGEQL
jgi:long-chain acyl-CoA synthetase